MTQTRKVGIVSVQNYQVCSKPSTLSQPPQPVSHSPHPHKIPRNSKGGGCDRAQLEGVLIRVSMKAFRVEGGQALPSPPVPSPHASADNRSLKPLLRDHRGQAHNEPSLLNSTVLWPPVTLIYKCGLKTYLPHSQHSSRSVLNKLTADKPKRGSAS